MLGASIRGGCGCKAWGITVSPSCLAFAECRILLGGGGGVPALALQNRALVVIFCGTVGTKKKPKTSQWCRTVFENSTSSATLL